MTPHVSRDEYDRMNWHQRQSVNERLERHTRDLLRQVHELDQQIASRQAAARLGTRDAAWVRQQARRVLAALPPDPDAAAHREALR